MPNFYSSGRQNASRLPPSAEVAGIVGQNARRPTSATSQGNDGANAQLAVVKIDQADTSSIPLEQQAIARSLISTYGYAQGLNASQRYKDKLDDMSKKLGLLLQRLNSQMVGEKEVALLLQLSNALDMADYGAANNVVKKLTTESWDENHQWILALKRLVDSVMTRT